MAAGVAERAVDAGADQAQVEVELARPLLENLQRHADVLQGLLGFSHGCERRDRRSYECFIEILQFCSGTFSQTGVTGKKAQCGLIFRAVLKKQLFEYEAKVSGAKTNFRSW